MKHLAIACLCAAGSLAGDFEDLGVLTPRTAIPLERNTDRGDFSFFQIEAKSAAKTNSLKFVTTNTLLFSTNFLPLPSGRVILGVRTILKDGSASPASTYAFELWRGSPPAPSAGKVIGILGFPDGENDSLEKIIQSRAKSEPSSPPLPPGMLSVVPLRARPKFESRPLPGGLPLDYAQNRDAESDRAAKEHYSKSRRD